MMKNKNNGVLMQSFYLKHLAAVLALAGLAGGVQAGTVTRTTSFDYDAATGNLLAQTREPDNTQLQLKTTYTYDSYGNVRDTNVSSAATGSAAIPAHRVSNVTYDANGVSPTSHTNALGQIIYGQYDASNLPTYIASLNGFASSWQYDGFGRKIKETRPNGAHTKWLYVLATSPGALVFRSGEKYAVETTSHAPSGTVNGPWQRAYFDELGRQVRTETQGFDGTSLIQQLTEYDALGRVYRTSRPHYSGQTPQWTTYTYDALGRTKSVTGPDGAVVSTAYNGLSTTVTNALNQTQTTVVNSLGKVVQVTDTQGKNLTYAYDAGGNLVKTTDPQGNMVTMVYDILGRKTSMTDPDLGTITYVYDALNQLKQQTNNKGQVTTFAYDLMGKMTSRAEPDLVSTWTYDTCYLGKGRLCKSTADNGYQYEPVYGSYGWVTGSKTTVDALYTTNLTFDESGRIATQVYPSGLTVKYVYTSLGYLSEVRNNATDALYWKANARDAEGHLTQQTYGNGVVTQQVFDPATGRVKNIYAGAGNAVQNLSFTFDKRGNMLSRSDANQNLNETFLYDTLNRLTSNTVNSGGAGLVTQTYGYDSIGNMTSRSDMGTYTYGAVNSKPHAVAQIALAGGGTRQYTYDGNGNMTQEVQRDAANNVIAAKGRTATYTSFDMPVTLASPSATLTFTYGPEHQRIKQISPTATTIYVHPDNEGGLSYEKDIKAGGVVEHKHYITAGGGVVAMVKQAPSGTSTVYFHRDHLGSTTATTNESGAVLERFAYEPFGKRRTPAGALDPNGTLVGVTTDRGFTNHEELDELGLIHMNGRVYDPTTGRLMTADPNVPYPTNIQSYNRYSYTRNNPLVMIDPSGFTDTFSALTDSTFNGNNSTAYWLTLTLGPGSSTLESTFTPSNNPSNLPCIMTVGASPSCAYGKNSADLMTELSNYCYRFGSCNAQMISNYQALSMNSNLYKPPVVTPPAWLVKNQTEANRIASEVEAKGGFSSKGEADWLYQLNSNPGLVVTVDASKYTAVRTGNWVSDGKGGLKASARLQGEAYAIYGQGTVRLRPDGTYGYFDDLYNYEMHKGMDPITIARNIATYLGEPPSNGMYSNTPFTVHFKGNVNYVEPAPIRIVDPRGARIQK